MNDKHEFTTLVIDDSKYQTLPTTKFLRRKKYVAPDPKKLLAYIPGIIQKINVGKGEKVRWGDSLLILEAMKMKNDVTAPFDAVIKVIHVRTGEMVMKNQLLIEFE
jgi:acetyl/propionyl-CoA carboxylase alpha subunit